MYKEKFRVLRYYHSTPIGRELPMIVEYRLRVIVLFTSMINSRIMCTHGATFRR